MNPHAYVSRCTLIASILVLTACGGGGSGSSDANPVSPANVANQPPVITGVSVDYVRSGHMYNFQPKTVDPENDSLLFTIQNQPDWAMFDQNSGQLTGIPDDQDIKHYGDIIISVSDGKNTTSLPPFSINVMYAEIGKDNVQINPNSAVTSTADGYDVTGEADITVGNLDTDLKNANLQFEYDANGDLLNLTGDADVPPVISNNLSLDSSVHAIVGMYTGAEINASMDIGPDSEPGIALRDEFRYLVYFLNAGVDMTFKGADGKDVPISLGLASTQTLIITDPTDPLFYYYGEISGAAVGYGNSFNGNIPYKPLFEPNGPTAFAPLEPFNGKEVLKGTFPISAFKVFDLLELTGEAVCSPPQLLDCGKPDPASIVVSAAQALLLDGGIDPSQQLKLGINGTAAIKFAVLGVDLFEYHLFDIASQIDIGTTREHLAMQGVIDPGQSSSPSWLPIKPIPDSNATMIGNLNADADPQTGDGDFGISLYGEIESKYPAATISGSVDINPRGLQMQGLVDNPDNPITVTASADDQAFEAGVQFGYDFQKNIDSVVNDGFDRALNKVDQTYNDLQNAIGDYNLAFSLNGFRDQIPTIVDATIADLNGLPQKVYDKVYSETLSGIDSASYKYDPCFSPIPSCPVTLHAKDFVDEKSIATTAATDAKNTTQSIVDARIAELNELKTQAQTATDPQLQQGLKTALQTVANHDTVSIPVKVSHEVEYKYAGVTVYTHTYTFYSTTLTYTVIDSTTKSNLLTAASNVDNIDPSYQFMVNTQQIFDALPTKDQINQAAQDVKDGVVDVPVVKGGGYKVTRDGDQSAYILLGNDRVDITFNPLDPAAAIKGVGDALAAYLTQ
jgi:hypothetical protein